MTEQQANEEALRIATEIFCEERRRGQRKNFLIIFLLVLNLFSLLLHIGCNLSERKGYNDGQRDRDSCVTDTVSPTS